MFNKKKPIVLFVVAVLAAIGLYQFAYGATVEQQSTAGQGKIFLNKKEGSFPYRSNNYTLPEQQTGAIASRAIPSDYKLIGETNSLQLYMSDASLAIMVKNKQTGYVWASMPSKADLKTAQLNDEWEKAIQSPILVEYYNGDEMLSNGSYLSLGGKVDGIESIEQGARVKISFANLNAGLALEVRLDSDSLVVNVPQKYMWEKGDNKLASIQAYPFLGAVHKADIPGYMFIPDRSGALIRFTKTHEQFDQPYVGKIYGEDLASDSGDTFSSRTSIPVFGLVHGVGQNGVMGIVEAGRFSAEVRAYPSGLSTDFYWVSPKFYIRYAFFQPTSKSMGGYNTYQKKAIITDRQVRYLFLGGDQADYVGMAKAYRSYLQNKGELVKKTKPKADIPIKVGLLGGDTEASAFGAQIVPMTTFNQAKTIVDRLAKLGITNLQLEYQGWNKGGLNGRRPAEFPVESKLGGQSGLKDLKQYLASRNIPLYLANGYTVAFDNTNELNFRSDATRSLSNVIIEFPIFGFGTSDFFKDINARLITPERALEIAKNDAKSMKESGADGLALTWNGNVLFSDYNAKHPIARDKSADKNRELADTFRSSLSSLAIYSANDYLWKYADSLYGMEGGSSQYMYETDTVPFVEIVLHGFIDYFAWDSNSNSSPREDTLHMIELGQYPSFLLTYEPYWKLRDTPSINLLTTQYTDLEQPLNEEYKALNQALRKVQDATIEAREVPDYGIAAVKYSNGVEIVVNYTSNDYTYNGVSVKAKSFAVIGG